MPHPPELTTLAQYLVGEFDNREQAIADPIWYVHLHLWHRPTHLFQADSITLFAEQANVLNLDQPYRQRLLRLHLASDNASPDARSGLRVQYYGFKDPSRVRGAGQQPSLLETITPEDLDFLPGCVLEIQPQVLENQPGFSAIAPPGACCQFGYQGKQVQVSLGFAVTEGFFQSEDKGINPETGQGTWGALMGPYRFHKRNAYSLNPRSPEYA